MKLKYFIFAGIALAFTLSEHGNDIIQSTANFIIPFVMMWFGWEIVTKTSALIKKTGMEIYHQLVT